jgi:hypothetical protein
MGFFSCTTFTKIKVEMWNILIAKRPIKIFRMFFLKMFFFNLILHPNLMEAFTDQGLML